jgi:hypothetical protein
MTGRGVLIPRIGVFVAREEAVALMHTRLVRLFFKPFRKDDEHAS